MVASISVRLGYMAALAFAAARVVAAEPHALQAGGGLRLSEDVGDDLADRDLASAIACVLATASTANSSRAEAVAYPDFGTAEKVRQELIEAAKEHLGQLDDAVIVEHEVGGKIKLHQVVGGTTGTRAAGGAMWGGLIGLIFLAPLVGMAVGAATGAAVGPMADLGVNDDFVKDLGAKLQPGAAALIVLGSTDARDKVIERVKPHGGEVIQTSLSTEEEERLRSALGEGASVA